MDDSALWEHVPEPPCFDTDVPTRIGNDKYNGKQAAKKAKKPKRKVRSIATDSKEKPEQKVLYFYKSNEQHRELLAHWNDIIEQHKSGSSTFIDYISIGYAVAQPDNGIEFLEKYYKGFIDKVKTAKASQLEKRIEMQRNQIDSLESDMLTLREELEAIRNRQLLDETRIEYMMPTVERVKNYITHGKQQKQVASQPAPERITDGK